LSGLLQPVNWTLPPRHCERVQQLTPDGIGALGSCSQQQPLLLINRTLEALLEPQRDSVLLPVADLLQTVVVRWGSYALHPGYSQHT
jgi:hypothetical protein